MPTGHSSPLAPRIRQMVARRVRVTGTVEVEDVVQDVLLSLHTARASYDATRPFLPWLTAIVRYRLADGVRRDARHRAHEVTVEDLDVTCAAVATNTSSGPERSTEELRDAIHALPPGQRKAIEMLKLGELSLREAAAVSGVSVGALKVATHRAIAALRRMLAAE